MTISWKGGAVPDRVLGGGPRSGGLTTYRVKPSYAQALYAGDPISVSTTGFAKLANDANFVGFAMGYFYVDAADKQPKEVRYLPASQTVFSQGEYEGVTSTAGVRVATGFNNETFRIAATIDTSVNRSDLGRLAQVVSAGEGDTITGRSKAKITFNAAVSGGAALPTVRIVDVPLFIDVATTSGDADVKNDFGTHGTVVEVTMPFAGFGNDDTTGA